MRKSTESKGAEEHKATKKRFFQRRKMEDYQNPNMVERFSLSALNLERSRNKQKGEKGGIIWRKREKNSTVFRLQLGAAFAFYTDSREQESERGGRKPLRDKRDVASVPMPATRGCG